MKRILTTFTLALLLSSCAHQFMRGTVAMKTNNKTAHVCLGNNDVRIGEKLDFYKNICVGGGGGGSSREGVGEGECSMRILGTGTVTKLLNSHYSEVKTDGSFAISEGTLVQKQI